MQTAAAIPAEFVPRYEAERARLLRRRLLWYCALALGLIALSAFTNYSELTDRLPATQADRQFIILDLTADLILIIFHIAALAYAASRQLDRPRLVGLVSWLIVLSGTVSILSAPTVHAGVPAEQLLHGPDGEAWEAGGYALLQVFVLHFLASLLIALSPQEGLRPIVPLLAMFALTTLTLIDASLRTRLALIAVSPLAGIPGFVWSWWRHRSFYEGFQSRLIARRYGELTQELEDARRVHETLFPPPLDRGPVRVDYSYEPASHIGGDFLFMSPPGPATPRFPAAPLSVILIDVTGHGIPAALAVTRLHDELARLFGDGSHPAPGKVLARLNRFALHALAPQGIFGTALCLRITPAADGPRAAAPATVEWASAGHPPALVLGGPGISVQLPPTATMLGVLDDEHFDPGARQILLDPDQSIIAYTDGLIEAQNPGHGPLGIDGLRDVIDAAQSEHPVPPAAPEHPTTAATADPLSGLTLAGRLLAAAVAHRNGPPTDDTLIIQITLAPRDPA
jgi:hypothetical protein